MIKLLKEQTNKLWQDHTLLIVCSSMSIVLFIIFAILQLTNCEIMKLNTQWLFVSGVPLLLALVVGGYIKTFKGFGIELESKLKSPVRSIDIKTSDAMIVLRGDDKESMEHLSNFTNEQIRRTKRLSFISGRRDYYKTHAILEYLKNLCCLVYLEVKRESGEFLCLVPTEEFREQYFKNSNDRAPFSLHKIDKFCKAIENDNVCLTYNNTCIDFIVNQDESLIDVLEKLRNKNKNFAVAVDSERRFVGLITSAEIERRIADDVLYSRRV